MAITGAIIAGVTAVAGASASAQKAASQKGASMSAQQARASNAEVNALFAGSSQGSLAQLMMSLSGGSAPSGVPPWMGGGSQGFGGPQG